MIPTPFLTTFHFRFRDVFFLPHFDLVGASDVCAVPANDPDVDRGKHDTTSLPQQRKPRSEQHGGNLNIFFPISSIYC